MLIEEESKLMIGRALANDYSCSKTADTAIGEALVLGRIETSTEAIEKIQLISPEMVASLFREYFSSERRYTEWMVP